MSQASNIFEKVSDSGQPHILVAQVKSTGLRHGQTAQITLSRLFAYPLKGGWQEPITADTLAEIRFCNMRAIQVHSRDGQGSSQEIPSEVLLDTRITEAMKKLGVLPADFFRLEKAEVSINGNIQIGATKETLVVFGDQQIAVLDESNMTDDEKLIEQTLAKPQTPSFV